MRKVLSSSASANATTIRTGSSRKNPRIPPSSFSCFSSRFSATADRGPRGLGPAVKASVGRVGDAGGGMDPLVGTSASAGSPEPVRRSTRLALRRLVVGRGSGGRGLGLLALGAGSGEVLGALEIRLDPHVLEVFLRLSLGLGREPGGDGRGVHGREVLARGPALLDPSLLPAELAEVVELRAAH